jgi:predicted branched-subunit amino acid permease
MLPFAWFASTFAGAYAGTFLGDPARFGADFAFTALFIGLIAGFWKSRIAGLAVRASRTASLRILIVIAASLIAAALVYVTAGPPWHVAAGAFAGILAAYIAGPAREAAR